ncbi:unnamed protein product [marine sediment metagenome]|uniref:CARDB domain-containing protein n=1 Tax=marine sediment metagenome TaxID=412755 RepID=X1QQM4_9ZZZZ
MAGTYSDIVEIEAPSSASAGEMVPVTIKIRNKYTAGVHVAAIGVYDSEERFIDWQYYWIPAGATHSFSGSFIMPARDVTIHAYSYYEAEDGYWYFDDEDEKDVSLAAPPEVYAGTISRKELEYDGARASVPAYDIPQGKRGLVHIWGRNDMATTQALGIDWVVRDPDGIEVEHYWDWSYGHGPGADHEFIGGRFDINKPGDWMISIALSMNPAAPEMVDSYYGILCTVAAAVPEPEFRAFGVTQYQTT